MKKPSRMNVSQSIKDLMDDLRSASPIGGRRSMSERLPLSANANDTNGRHRPADRCQARELPVDGQPRPKASPSGKSRPKSGVDSEVSTDNLNATSRSNSESGPVDSARPALTNLIDQCIWSGRTGPGSALPYGIDIESQFIRKQCREDIQHGFDESRSSHTPPERMKCQAVKLADNQNSSVGGC